MINVARLAELARLEAERQPPRSAARRAASHLYYSLTDPPAKTLGAARQAIATFGTTATQQAALELLGKITNATKGPAS